MWYVICMMCTPSTCHVYWVRNRGPVRKKWCNGGWEGGKTGKYEEEKIYEHAEEVSGINIIRCRVITTHTRRTYKLTGRRRDVGARMTREGVLRMESPIYIIATASYPRTTCSALSITRVALQEGCLWLGVGRGWMDWSSARVVYGKSGLTRSACRAGDGGRMMGWTGLVPMVSPPVLTARTVAVIVCWGISFGGPSSTDGRTDG